MGTAIEIVGPDTARRLALARRLRATPFLQDGQTSLLATLADVAARAGKAGLDEDAILAVQAHAASRFAGHCDEAMADVACAVGGITPTFIGGLFAWLKAGGTEHIAKARARHAGTGLLD